MTKILIIDDDEMIRERLQKILNLEGYQSYIAENGLMGLDVFRTERPDIALVDIRMPGIGGVEVLKKIKEEAWKTEVIMITGHADAQTAIEALRVGAFGYISKPIEFDELEIEIRRALEKQNMERDQENLISELEEKNQELEQFTYIVSHDLNSPIGTIESFVDLLNHDLKKGHYDDVDEYFRKIYSVIKKAKRLLNELLKLSRSGRVTNKFEKVPLEKVAHEAVYMVSGKLERRSVKVKVSSDLPIVDGDHLKLVSVFQNLIENAVKFMGAQSDPRIEIGIRKEGYQDIFFVRDNGIGIDPRYQKEIFEVFNRLSAKIEGTGIGLAIVKRIIELHKGCLWVESEGEGKGGSTFCFSLGDKNGKNFNC